MFILCIKFILSAAIVVFAGYKICIYADKIAQIVKIGRTFIGLMLLAVVTSLPEMAVTISAVKIQALDLGLGDLFGSNLFNLTIVGIIFLAFIKKPKMVSFEPIHFISLSISAILITLASMGIVFYNFINPHVGYSKFLLDLWTVLILVIYLFGAYLIFRSEKSKTGALPEKDFSKSKGIAQTWLKFLAFSALLVGFAIYLARLGDIIAQIPVAGVALGGTFVGSLLIAITTSLPETAVAISAIRLGFLDMALGNIFGSNMFNMLIIPIMDLALGRKVILSCVSSVHLFTALFVLISTALVSVGLIYRSRRKIPGLAWDSFAILFVYFAANVVNFYLR
ncbi:MAG: hypothetical protein NG712_02485 [Omnitrophica bacterium]|nr:hypothetical protein [Candidatus Omnitrophota bacterium]